MAPFFYRGMDGHFTLFLFLKTITYFVHADVPWTNVVEQREEFFFIDQDSHVLIFSFQLLGDMLLDRSNAAVMMRYVSSKDNLMILMNLLRVSVPHFTSGNLSLQSTCRRLKCSTSDSLYYLPPFLNFLVFYLFCQDSSKNIQIEAFHVFKVCTTALTSFCQHKFA